MELFRGAGFAIGQYSDIALDVIQREFNADMSIEQAIRIGNKGIEKALGEKPLVETRLVIAKEGYLRKLSQKVQEVFPLLLRVF